MSYQYQTEEQKALSEQDRINRQTPFDPKKQFYPADLFILKGFYSHSGIPIWERNERWHNKKGYFTGRTSPH
jgi:hypothetical protein